MRAIATGRPSLLRLAAALCYGGAGVAAFVQSHASELTLESGSGIGTGLTYAGPSSPANLGSFAINIVPGSGLSGNAPALAAFQRAANQWAAFISDPISVNINADLASMSSASIIGSTSSVVLQADYNTIRNAVVADAGDEPSNVAVGFLPTAAQFTAQLKAGTSLTGGLSLTKANAKALGFSGLDVTFGASDGSITFNSKFNFDYDNSDGVTAGFMDFETVAAHEIGHALGFISDVDDVDGGSTAVQPTTWDLFRFNTANNPSTTSDFTTFPRNLVPGATDLFDDLTLEGLLSTGVALGDGRQASHWKDDGLTGTYLGVMDPTLPFGTIELITARDRQVLDSIGYEVAALAVPEASTYAAGGALLLAVGGTWLRARRRG